MGLIKLKQTHSTTQDSKLYLGDKATVKQLLTWPAAMDTVSLEC